MKAKSPKWWRHAIWNRCFRDIRPAAIVLGCTHFPVLATAIRTVVARLSAPVPLVDSAITTANAVSRLVAEKAIARSAQEHPFHTFLTTDAPERFARVGAIFLGREPDNVTLVDIQDD